VDQRGQAFVPDFRRHEGSLRALIREYAVEREREASTFSWGAPQESGSEEIEATTRLIELALEAGVLVDASLKPITAEAGREKLVLAIEPATDQRIGVRPLLAGRAQALGDGELLVLGPRQVLFGGKVREVSDLGPQWRGLNMESVLLKPEDLMLHLSSAASRFSGIEPSRKDYTVLRGSARLVRPALLFREIDAYGYLHVRPFGFVEGFPPGFIEDGELSMIVEIDEAARSFTMADLVFSRFADEEFRKIVGAAGKEARAAVFEEAGRFIFDPGFAQVFLEASMRELMANFLLFEAEKLARYHVLALRPKLRFRFDSGIDFLGGEAEVELAGERFPFSALLLGYEREGFVRLADGTKAYPESRDIERFKRLLTRISASAGSEEGSRFAVSEFDLPALEREAAIEEGVEAWDRARAFFQGLNALPEEGEGLGAGIAGGELRGYQRYGVSWIGYLARHGRHGCLADEMGLGKTIQTLAALRVWRRDAGKGEGPVLVVMPRSLLFNWKAEFARFAPEFRLLLHHGAERGESLPRGASGPDLVILTSYATLRNDIELFKGLEFSWLILDESQSIKTAGTQTRAAVMSLRSRHRLALSGTPVENHLGELWSLFEFLEPGFFGGPSNFTRHWKTPIENDDPEALRELKSRIYPFILRRRKAEVLTDLPPRTEQTTLVELEPEHLAVYNRRRQELRESIERAVMDEGVAKSSFLILAALTELRRLASVPEADGTWQGMSAKRVFLQERLPELVESGHKALLFTNWLATVDLVSEDLGGLGIGNLVMTGATSDRASLVERFQTDPAVCAFTMTLKTGGLGLNLTAADYVFILDPWWNRAAEAQAIDRTHRIGQVNPVFCYRLIAKDTIEERLLELQERKASIVDAVLGSEADFTKRLSADDISFLLG
jgi:superfamily II DNA or RNA helicase